MNVGKKDKIEIEIIILMKMMIEKIMEVIEKKKEVLEKVGNQVLLKKKIQV